MKQDEPPFEKPQSEQMLQVYDEVDKFIELIDGEYGAFESLVNETLNKVIIEDDDREAEEEFSNIEEGWGEMTEYLYDEGHVLKYAIQRIVNKTEGNIEKPVKRYVTVRKK